MTGHYSSSLHLYVYRFCRIHLYTEQLTQRWLLLTNMLIVGTMYNKITVGVNLKFTAKISKFTTWQLVGQSAPASVWRGTVCGKAFFCLAQSTETTRPTEFSLLNCTVLNYRL